MADIEKPQIAVRQLLDPNNIFSNEDWRFVRQTDGNGAYTGEVILVSRRPLKITNEALQNLLSTNRDTGLRLATTGEFVDAHRPFDDSERVYSNYQYPWGNNYDFSDATEPFIYQGVTRGGLVGFGPSKFRQVSEDGQEGGIWAVTGDGNRIGAPWNIHGYTPLEDIIASIPSPSGQRATMSGYRAMLEGKRANLGGDRGNLSDERGELGGERGSLSGSHAELSGERGTLSGERGELTGERGNISGERAGEQNVVRQAGINASPPKELEENEGYFLARKPSKQELDFFVTATHALGPRLTADNGVTVLTPPDFIAKKGFFIPAGGCAECANQRGITWHVVRQEISKATGITLELPEEVHRYMELMESRIAKQELPAESRRLANNILEFYRLSGDNNLAQKMITVALPKIPKDLAAKFVEYVTQGQRMIALNPEVDRDHGRAA